MSNKNNNVIKCQDSASGLYSASKSTASYVKPIQSETKDNSNNKKDSQ